MYPKSAAKCSRFVYELPVAMTEFKRTAASLEELEELLDSLRDPTTPAPEKMATFSSAKVCLTQIIPGTTS